MNGVTNITIKNSTEEPKEKVRLQRDESAFRELLNGKTDEELKAMVQGYSHLVVSGIPLACVREREKLVKLIQYAKDAGTKIVFSTNLRATNWQMPDNDNPEGLQAGWQEKAKKWQGEVLPLADVIFANYKDEKDLRGDATHLDVIKNLKNLNANSDIVLTDDGNAIHAYSHTDDVLYRMPAHRPVKKHPLFTVGAGDALAATTLIATEAGKSLEDAVKLGTYVASQVVNIRGATPNSEDPRLSFDLEKSQVHRR